MTHFVPVTMCVTQKVWGHLRLYGVTHIVTGTKGVIRFAEGFVTLFVAAAFGVTSNPCSLSSKPDSNRLRNAYHVGD